MSPVEAGIQDHLELNPQARIEKFDAMFEDGRCVVETADEQIVELLINGTKAAALTRHLFGVDAGDRAVIRKAGKSEFTAYCFDRLDPTELKKHSFDTEGAVFSPGVELERTDYLWVDRVLCRGQPRQLHPTAQAAA